MCYYGISDTEFLASSYKFAKLYSSEAEHNRLPINGIKTFCREQVKI